ncbi:MAG: low specificity L-threonine aldolase [Lachnospiraceae bacterium]|nr:low specificity L-threonine aldolase [Lachnospiraceae bacterium]MBR0153863.1 low specificity L-threonine aldolase [Lachnospiraceae bacterium]
MISFESDYICGAHPKVLARLCETNLEALPGYGSDRYCEAAKEKIRQACGCPDAQVEFLVGGTQTNEIVIATLLRDWEGVVAAKTGHISVHEAGAVEYNGHKVLEVPETQGKIPAKVLRAYLEGFYADDNHEHMVFPGMVYISHPTEYGTLYTKAELTALSEVCRAYDIPLFLDGARLGYGLASLQTDLDLRDIAALTDVFYIGGTKVGALCGEAVVYPGAKRPAHFLTSIKKRGALLAKGRLLGVQFDALFTDGLYLEISRYAIRAAEELKEIIRESGLPFFLESPTNQQFVILTNEQLKKLSQEVAVSFWEAYDADHTVVRLATSWSTTEEDLESLRGILARL